MKEGSVIERNGGESIEIKQEESDLNTNANSINSVTTKPET